MKEEDANTEWYRDQPGRIPMHSLIEGPSFDCEGNLWTVDIPWGRVFKMDR